MAPEAEFVLVMFPPLSYPRRMPEPDPKLTLATPYVVMKKPPLGGHDQVARGFGQK
jgi:hypothetical protein